MKRFASKGHLASGFPVLLLAMASWVVALGGLAALQQKCTSGPNTGVTLLARLPQLPPGSCKRFYRFDWWVVAFEGFTLFLVFIALATARVYHGRVGLVAFLAIASVLFMYEANLFLNYHDNVGRAFGDIIYKRAVVYFAGSVLCVICNLLLILILGSGVYKGHPDNHFKGTTDATGATPYGTPAGTTATGYAPGTTTNVV